MQYEPQVEIEYGETTFKESGTVAPFVAVTNAGDRPIKEVAVEWVVTFETPQQATDEFKRLHGESFSANTGQNVVRADKLGCRYSFIPQGEGPLNIGEKRGFAFPPEWMAPMLSMIQSLSPERYFVAVTSDGHEDVAVKGTDFGDFVSERFGN